MSTYIKAKTDQKRQRKKVYNELLFQAASAVLPSVVIKAPDDATPGEMVDNAILLATNLLAELGYNYKDDSDA
jgi:hypothetical protein